MKKMKCSKCDHEWIPHVEKPKACPRCKNYLVSKKEIDAKKKARKMKKMLR